MVKQVVLKQSIPLDDLEKEDTTHFDSEEEDDDIQAEKVMKEKEKPLSVSSIKRQLKTYNVKPKDPDKPKRERTQKQIDAFQKVLEIRQIKRDERKLIKETIHEKMKREILEKEEEAKQALEDKIVKKAISIKKKQIKKEVVLDEISDDDDDIEEVKKIVKKRSQPIRKQYQEEKISYTFI